MPNVKMIPVESSQASAILGEVSRRADLFQERDAVMHNLRKYRLLRHQPRLPKAYQARFGGERAPKLPIIYRLVQTAVSAAAKKPPLVQAEALSASDRKASEDWSRGMSLLLQAVDNQTRRPFLYGLLFTLFGDGLAVTKSLPGPWSDYPLPNDDESSSAYNKRVQEFMHNHPLPFYCRIVNPLTFYPPIEEYGDGAAIESAWRPLADTLRTFRLKLDGKTIVPMTPGEEKIPGGFPYPADEPLPTSPASAKVTEVWTKENCAVIIDGYDKVLLFENPIGELPYEWGFADPTGVEDPTNIGMSVAFPLYYIQPWIDTMVAAMAAWSVFAMPTVFTTQDPVPGVRPTAETAVETLQLGKMYHFATGRKPGILQPPDIGREVTGFLNFLVESADRGGLPAMVSGAGVGTRLPALTFQAAFEAATDRLRPAVQSAEKILSGTLQKWQTIIARYDTPVKVNGWEYEASGDPRTRRWASLKPSEARKGRRVMVHIPVDSTQDLIAKGTHAQFMMNAQLWDMERAMRFAGVENPEETRNKIAADLVWRASLHPLAEALISQTPAVAAQIAQEAQQEGGVPNVAGLGAPPGPGRNRQGVPAGRGGGRRGIPTQRPRGNRQGAIGQTYGRS